MSESRNTARNVRRARTNASAALLAAVLFGTADVRGQLLSVDVSTDITWIVGATAIDDEGARRVTLPATVSTLDLGALPANADVTAYLMLDDGRRVFALDSFVALGGALTAGPEDLISWNGSSFALFLDGSAIGISAGTMIDAAARQRLAGVTYTLLSFDVPTALPGGLLADDEDVVAWSGSTWSMFFDGSSNGIPESLDIDGFDRDPVNGDRFFSFDASGRIATVDFEDEDVVAFNGSTWSLVFDSSANLGTSFAAGDLDALGVRTVNIFKNGFENATTIEWSAANP